MKLGLSLGSCVSLPQAVEVGVRAEEFGFESVWTSEAWGSDAFTPLAAIASRTKRVRLGTAIAQMPARTPAATGMTAMTLQELSGGRFELGLGVSGPQVVEGWHGVPFRSPLATTREYVAILRSVMAADQRVAHSGEMFNLPYIGPGSTGLGRSLRSTLNGWAETSVSIAAIGPRNVALAAEIADGLLPYLWSPTHWKRAYGDVLATAPEGFRIAPTVLVSLGDDLQQCRDAVRPRIALHVGGMGSRDKNFYKDLVMRYGYEREVQAVQNLYLAGRRDEASAAVSDALVDDLSLVGTVERIADRLDAWRDGVVTTIILEPLEMYAIETLARLSSIA